MPETINDTEIAQDWRQKLKQHQSQIEARFLKNADTAYALRSQAKFVDDLLRALWRKFGLHQNCCLIAVGGYGRGELFPYSDVDILILLKNAEDEHTNQSIESLIGLLWDVGLAIGHSVRTLQECEAEAQKDVTVQTNLLESRLLDGNKSLYLAFEAAINDSMNIQDFFKSKILEQQQRHARFNDTAYNLEPNVKESPGGLRDLQNIIWIARSLKLGNKWTNLADHGLISAREARQIRRHELHLQMLRIRLHYLSKRREDRLLFDFQNDLAKELGLSNNGSKRASEQLMHSYYRSAKFVGIINEMLLQLLEERVNPESHPTEPINQYFESRNNLLEIRSASLIQQKPNLILQSFLMLQTHPKLEGMSASLLRTILRVKNLVNHDFRNDPENKKTFLQILKEPLGVTETLKRMNRYGILGEYIPAFGKITGQMQHDLFHVYTVDEHILNVLRNLRRFAFSIYSHEFPLCSQLFAEFKDPYLLYLGALFHDIAKGRGGDHSTIGAVDAKRFCRNHGINKIDSDLVAWLVDSHLTMSSVAQKSDLSDPAVIESFSKKMGDERHLIALYLLTVADIRGTSPAVWNAWKARLLESLYQASKRYLNGAESTINNEILMRQENAIATLNHYGVNSKSYQQLWAMLDSSYFLRHRAQEIAWHARLLITHINTDHAIVRSRLSPDGDGIQVMIYTKDRDDVFARICSFFDRLGYNILEAKIHTTKHHYALDSFLVADQSRKSVVYRDLLQFIEHELTQKIEDKKGPDLPLHGRLSRQVKLMPIKSTITLNAEENSNNHVLEIVTGDRPGLLSRLAQTFLKHGVHLHTAKINTLGSRAEDSFLISARSNNKLSEDLISKLKIDLSHHL